MITPRRTGRDRQPQQISGAESSNPIRKGLVVAYDAGLKYDAITRRPSVKTGTVNKYLNEDKTGITLGTTSSYESFASSFANVTGDITVLVFARTANTSSDMSAVSKNNANGGPSDPTPFDFGLTTGGTASIGKVRLARSNSGGYRVWSSAATIGVDTDFVIAARQGSNISVSPVFFVNGAKDGGAATNLYGGAGTGAAGGNAFTVKIANRGDVGTYWNGGAIYAAFVWERLLSDDEIRAVTANPWQLFEEEDDFAFFPDVVGGSQTLTPSLYTNGQSFYAPAVSLSGGTQTLTPALFTNTASFYAATLTASNTLAPSLYSNAQSFYGPTLQASYAVTPSLYANASSFFAATLATSNVLSPSLYVNGQSFYSPTVSIAGGPQQLTANRIDNTSVFYAPTLAPGAVSVAPSLYNNSQAFYTLTVTTSKTLAPALFTNSNAVYDPVVSLGSGPQVISPTLFVNAQSYFTQTVVPGSVSLFPVLLANSSTFYAPSVSNGSFSGQISDADINRIVAAVLSALNSTTIPVNAVMGWPSPSDIADAVWSKQLP